MAGELAVWLYGEKVALINEERRRPRLTYTDTALARYPLGTPLLSLALPVQPERHPQGVVRSFLEGLLPEGQARLTVARDFNLRASDTLGLIRAIGRDCAGAVVIQPADQPPPPPASTLKAERLTDSDIELLVSNLRTAPLGVDERVRVSLGGVQEKLLLTRMPDGTWGRPVDGTPTTHILKPEIARLPSAVANEAFCMRLGKHLGVTVAAVDTMVAGHRTLLVVERYDRVLHGDGTVERIHQQDLCQALGLLPDQNYEQDGGPSLKRLGQVLENTAELGVLEALLRAVTLNAVIGNGDAHAKNFSLLHQPSGVLTLAPLYDLLCTLYYGDDRLAMYIDNVHKTNRLTSERIVNEAVTWGISRVRAREITGEILDGAPKAIDAAHDETHDLPDKLVTTVQNQLEYLQTTA